MMSGWPTFQQWLALTQAARRLAIGDSSGVDISVPNVIELNAGIVGVEH